MIFAVFVLAGLHGDIIDAWNPASLDLLVLLWCRAARVTVAAAVEAAMVDAHEDADPVVPAAAPRSAGR